MTQEQWEAVDRYFVDALGLSEPALEAALEASDAAGLPAISVAPTQGKLLQLLARLQGATRILEIGTLGGYSTIWLARALPVGGRMVTLEYEPKHAEVARVNLANAGLGDAVEIRIGRALETLPQLVAEGQGPFDLIFIDADKATTPEYVSWALKLACRGSLIVVDNVVRNGAVADASSGSADVQGIRRFFDLVASEPRLTGTALQTVGSKGYDGLALALVTE